MPYPNTSSTALFEAEKDGGFEVGVTPIPGTKEGKTSTFLGGDAMGISKDCKHVAQAWNFLAWLMSDDAQKEVFAANGDTASNIQTLKTAYDDADPRVQTINSVIIDAMARPRSPQLSMRPSTQPVPRGSCSSRTQSGAMAISRPTTRPSPTCWVSEVSH